jgi:hypothetical protein
LTFVGEVHLRQVPRPGVAHFDWSIQNVHYAMDEDDTEH